MKFYYHKMFLNILRNTTFARVLVVATYKLQKQNIYKLWPSSKRSIFLIRLFLILYFRLICIDLATLYATHDVLLNLTLLLILLNNFSNWNKHR